MERPTLTPHQQEALDWLVAKLTRGTPLVALRGLAGVGKSVMIPYLADRLVAAGIPVTVGAPTHRAAMILRQKGLASADTIHAHALTPYFLPAYAACLRWLGEDCPTRESLPYLSTEVDTPMEDDLPALLAEAMATQEMTLQGLLTRAKTYAPKRVLESLGIHGRHYFDGFGAKQGEGCLIIDEASMVGHDTLALCQRAFPLICLVGDPGQLPPVKDEAILAGVDGFELTEIHRQAAESPIVQLAYAARQGTATWQALPCKDGELEEWLAVGAQKFLTAPLIVWRNKVRLACTTAIRTALGYPAYAVVPGEPLVCRATNQEDRADGYYNNALFHVVDVSTSQPETVTVQEDGTDTTHTVRLHVEELHGDSIHPKAIPFRFAYCLTAHTAQGGEWPTVYIAKPELQAYLGASRTRGTQDDGARWAYTAITRAKQTLGFVLQYDFTQSIRRPLAASEESSMPTKTAPPVLITSDVFPEFTPPDVLLDDIPDPLTPPGVAQGQAPTVQAEAVHPGPAAEQLPLSVDQALFKFSQHSATILASVEKSWETKLRSLEHQQHALEYVAEVLKNYAPCVPYSASVVVTSPAGFVMTLSVQNATQEGFLGQMSTLMSFLMDNQFTPHIPAPF